MSLLTFGERLGLILLTQTSAVSACAIVGLLTYIAYSAVSVTRGSSIRWRLSGPAEVYFLNQLSWDLVQAVGTWPYEYQVGNRCLCSARVLLLCARCHQASLRCRSSAFLISLYTLRTLCFSRVMLQPDEEEKARKKSLRRSLVVVTFLWSAVVLIVTANIDANGAHRFYGPAGYWCWIQPMYSVQRTAADFAFIWATAISNIASYFVVFLYFRGYITTNGWKIRVCRRPDILNVLGPSKQAYGMLFYPLVYIFSVLPLSAVRYSSFTHHNIPFGVTVFTDMIYLSSGLLNVLLFSITRPFLLPHDLPKPDEESDMTVPHIRIADSQHINNSHQGGWGADELDHWPRSESPISHIQTDSVCEASTKESDASLYGDEKPVVMNQTSHSLNV